MLHLHGGALPRSKTGKRFVDFCSKVPVLVSIPLIYPTLRTCVSKLIKICSVKFYVIRTMCCTAFFLLFLPSVTVTLSDLMYVIEYCPIVSRTWQIAILLFVCCFTKLTDILICIFVIIYVCLFLSAQLRPDSLSLNGYVMLCYVM